MHFVSTYKKFAVMLSSTRPIHASVSVYLKLFRSLFKKYE